MSFLSFFSQQQEVQDSLEERIKKALLICREAEKTLKEDIEKEIKVLLPDVKEFEVFDLIGNRNRYLFSFESLGQLISKLDFIRDMQAYLVGEDPTTFTKITSNKECTIGEYEKDLHFQTPLVSEEKSVWKELKVRDKEKIKDLETKVKLHLASPALLQRPQAMSAFGAAGSFLEDKRLQLSQKRDTSATDSWYMSFFKQIGQFLSLPSKRAKTAQQLSGILSNASFLNQLNKESAQTFQSDYVSFDRTHLESSRNNR